MSRLSAFSNPATLKLALACDLSEVREAAQAVRRFLAGQGCTEKEQTACDLSLVEACNNAIKYADGDARRKPVRVECLCESAQIELRVTDHTSGFIWPRRAQLPAPESESGRGVYLIQTLMDRANYFRAAGENVLMLCKHRAFPPDGEPSPAAPDSQALQRQLAENQRIVGNLVEELSSCYESLSAIFRYGGRQSQIGDLPAFAHRLLVDLLHITSADWFVLRLAPPGEARLAVLAASEPVLNLDSLAIPEPAQKNGPVELEAAASRCAVWFDESRPLEHADPLGRVKPGSHGLVHPIFFNGNLIGTLALGKSARADTPPAEPAGLVFTASQTNVIGTFAEFLAIQVVNTRFQEEQVASRLVAHELQIANSIQQSLLLQTLPQLPGFGLAAHCRSAQQVGGDFYDVLRVNDHSLLLVVADVMGKGVPAAMFAVILRTMLRAAPELTHQPSALLTRVNRLLFEDLSGVDMFITAQLAHVDARERRIVTASAGHCPLLVASSGGVRQFSPEGMPLGILPETTFSDEIIDLPRDARVLLYTDGLIEAVNAAGERYGEERLAQWLQASSSARRTAEELKRELAESLREFQRNTVLNDDETFLIMTE